MEGFRSNSLTLLFQIIDSSKVRFIEENTDSSIYPSCRIHVSSCRYQTTLLLFLQAIHCIHPAPPYNKESWNFDLTRAKIYRLVWFCWGCFKTCDCTGAWRKGNPLLPRAYGICPFHLLIACH
jgi:hypothetical protein